MAEHCIVTVKRHIGEWTDTVTKGVYWEEESETRMGTKAEGREAVESERKRQKFCDKGIKVPHRAK